MCRVAISVFVAIGLFVATCNQAIESQYQWHEDAEDQWSVTLRDGGKLFFVLEAGDRPLFLVMSHCPNNPKDITQLTWQWYAGDRFAKFVNCKNQEEYTQVPPVLESLKPLPLRARDRLRRDWEQPHGSPRGEVLYALGAFYRP